MKESKEYQMISQSNQHTFELQKEQNFHTLLLCFLEKKHEKFRFEQNQILQLQLLPKNRSISISFFKILSYQI